MNCLLIPRIFYEYSEKLSVEAFSFLIKLFFYIDDKETNDNPVFIKYLGLEKKKLLPIGFNLDMTLNEIMRTGLIEFEKKEDNYNISFKNLETKVIINKNSRVKDQDYVLSGYIDSIVDKFSPAIRQKVEKLLKGVIEFQEKCNKSSNKELHNITMAFVDAPDLVVGQVCDIYNARYRGRRGAEYIIGILKRQRADVMVRVEREDIAKYREETEKAENRTAEFIANGTILESQDALYYKSLLIQKRFKKLKELHKLGSEILKGKNVFKDYEWLK